MASLPRGLELHDRPSARYLAVVSPPGNPRRRCLSTWCASIRHTKEYGSSWIFEPCLTWANALRRVQHPGFSLVSARARPWFGWAGRWRPARRWWPAWCRGVGAWPLGRRRRKDGGPIPAPGARRTGPAPALTSSSITLVDPTTLLMFFLPGGAGAIPAAHPGSGPAEPRTVGRMLWLRWKRLPGS